MDSRVTEDAWSVDLPSCRRQDLYPASAGGPDPAPALAPSVTGPGPITRRTLQEACQVQRHHLHAATQAGTLKDKGKRPDHLRRHIELGLAVAQQLLGQKNTQHRTRDEFQGRHDTAGGQVCGHNCTGTGCLFCMPQHMCPSLPDPFAAQCARRTFPAV